MATTPKEQRQRISDGLSDNDLLTRYMPQNFGSVVDQATSNVKSIVDGLLDDYEGVLNQQVEAIMNVAELDQLDKDLKKLSSDSNTDLKNVTGGLDDIKKLAVALKAEVGTAKAAGVALAAKEVELRGAAEALEKKLKEIEEKVKGLGGAVAGAAKKAIGLP